MTNVGGVARPGWPGVPDGPCCTYALVRLVCARGETAGGPGLPDGRRFPVRERP